MTLDAAYQRVRQFRGRSLKHKISVLEGLLKQSGAAECKDELQAYEVNEELLRAALRLKLASAQINEVVHAVGILLSLPYILAPEEAVQYLSLAAGNTGRPFDLETNRRIAEFKFIDWKGGPESIRQNSLFKDFFELAEYDSPKQRFLYVVGLEHPMRFFTGGRACASVMGRNKPLWDRYSKTYTRFLRVREFYEHKKSAISIIDLATIVPALAGSRELLNSGMVE
jgi:hypothetical protein